MEVTTSATDPVIVMTRVFDAPRAMVWSALTDPKHVVHWYGGHGFENPVCEMDVRPGGTWNHVMRAPDGSEYKMKFVYLEVVPPEKLAWRSADGEPPRPGMHESPVMVCTLEDLGQKTRWKLVSRFSSVAARDATLKMGFTHVLAQGCEKLNDIVVGLASRAVH